MSGPFNSVKLLLELGHIAGNKLDLLPVGGGHHQGCPLSLTVNNFYGHNLQAEPSGGRVPLWWLQNLISAFHGQCGLWASSGSGLQG